MDATKVLISDYYSLWKYEWNSTCRHKQNFRNSIAIRWKDDDYAWIKSFSHKCSKIYSVYFWPDFLRRKLRWQTLWKPRCCIALNYWIQGTEFLLFFVFFLKLSQHFWLWFEHLLDYNVVSVILTRTLWYELATEHITFTRIWTHDWLQSEEDNFDHYLIQGVAFEADTEIIK